MYLPIKSLQFGGQNLPLGPHLPEGSRKSCWFFSLFSFSLLPRQSHSFQAVLKTGGQPCPTRSGGSSLERAGQLPKAAWEQQGCI